MKVILEKHGGLAGGIRRMFRVVDSNSLPMSAAVELARLVTAAKASTIAQNDDPGHTRDVMSYTITVEDGSQSTVLN